MKRPPCLTGKAYLLTVMGDYQTNNRPLVLFYSSNRTFPIFEAFG